MTLFCMILAGLLVAAVLLFLIAGWQQRQAEPDARDRLNTAFYQQRLHELARDEAEGVVASRAEMERELTQTLLSDVPAEKSLVTRQSSRWILLPGVLFLMLVSTGLYVKTGGYSQLAAWFSVQHDYPALRARLLDPAAEQLTPEELARLQLGLRTRLQQETGSADDWAMLGRLSMVLNNTGMAGQALERALQRAPGNIGLQQDYAEVLTRSPDAQDNRQATLLLKALLRHDRNNIRTLSLLAFNAFEQQNYNDAISAWQSMLTLLPAGDQRIIMVQRSIEQAKSDAGQQAVKLAITVELAPQVKNSLPPNGVLYISVSDGVSSVPVAVRRMPLSRFPLTLTLDDSNAMMPDRLLSAQHQIQVRVRIARDGSARPQTGDWFGLSAITAWEKHQPLTVEISQQQP